MKLPKGWIALVFTKGRTKSDGIVCRNYRIETGPDPRFFPDGNSMLLRNNQKVNVIISKNGVIEEKVEVRNDGGKAIVESQASKMR